MSKRKHEVLVIYKSGALVTVECDNFTVKRNGLGVMHSIEWENASPDPLFAGVDNIAAIWQVK